MWGGCRVDVGRMWGGYRVDVRWMWGGYGRFPHGLCINSRVQLKICLFCIDIRKTMDSQYSEENSMESHTEDDNSITTEERDENSSEEEQSSITTENSSEEEIDPWSTLINDAASKVRDQYDDILQALLMEGHHESEAKQEALKKFFLFSKRMETT